MNTSEYLNFIRCQDLIAKPIANKPCENYIVATTDDNLIFLYSMHFRNDGYNVDVIDLTNPANSTVSYDVFQQIESAADAKWLANQLEAPWLQDDPYWQIISVSLIASLLRVLKHSNQGTHVSSLIKIVDDLYIGVMRDEKVPLHIEKLISDIISVDPHSDLANELELLASLPRETLKVICKHSSKILHHYFRYTDNSAVRDLSTYDTCTLLENKTVLFVKYDSDFIEQENCASVIIKCIAKSLYCHVYEKELARLPVKTNFLCESRIFQSLCCDILGDSIAPHLGLCAVCLGYRDANDSSSHIWTHTTN